MCGIEPGSEKEVERAVSRVFTTVRTGKFDPTLLAASLAFVNMSVASAFENVDSTVGYVLFRRLFGRTADPDEIVASWEKITLDDLAAFAKKVRPDAVYLLTPKGGDQNG